MCNCKENIEKNIDCMMNSSICLKNFKYNNKVKKENSRGYYFHKEIENISEQIGNHIKSEFKANSKATTKFIFTINYSRKNSDGKYDSEYFECILNNDSMIMEIYDDRIKINCVDMNCDNKGKYHQETILIHEIDNIGLNIQMKNYLFNC